MSNYASQGQAPTLVIDFKNNLIRIHRNTLHILGDPKYVQLLVHPESMMLILRGSIRNSTSQKINPKMTDGRQSFELYSKGLVKSLLGVCPVWEDEQAYRMKGEYIHAERITRFNMRESVLIHNHEDSKEKPYH